jgi:hypothetical protein
MKFGHYADRELPESVGFLNRRSHVRIMPGTPISHIK